MGAIDVVDPRSAVSTDTCARVNALIKYSNCKMYLFIDEYQSHARVSSIVPDYRNPGFVIANCNSAFHGDLRVQVGNGVGFVFKFL